MSLQLEEDPLSNVGEIMDQEAGILPDNVFGSHSLTTRFMTHPIVITTHVERKRLRYLNRLLTLHQPLTHSMISFSS